MSLLDTVIPGAELATSVAGNIIGGIATANIAKKQQAALNGEKAYSESLFNKEYYQDVLDRSENKSMLRELQNNQKQNRVQAQRTAAITGATPEAAVMQQKNDANVYASTVNRMAGLASQRKDQALAGYNARRSALFNAQNGIEEQKKAAWGTFMGNASDLGNAALTQFGGSKPTAQSSGKVPGFEELSKTLGGN